LLQLFTIGLTELSPDGTPVDKPGGGQVELESQFKQAHFRLLIAAV
jgi:hypothetical protein